MIASLTFAQAPLAKKTTTSNKIEKMLDINAIMSKTGGVNDAKEMQAAMAEKAAAAKETSTSLFRIGTRQHVWLPGINSDATLVAKLDARNAVAVPSRYKASPRKTTTQEGNVTVTTDEHGIITDVTGVEAKDYLRAATGTAYYASSGSMSQAKQSGLVTIIEDGNNVYIKNPVTRYTVGSWVKGVKSGNNITVATKQPLSYDSQYNATASLRWGLINTQGKISAADETAEVFTFTVDGNVLTLQGTAAYDGSADALYMGVFWDDDNSASGYGDAATVLTYDPTYVPPSTELVTLPEGAQVSGWYLNGNSVSSSATTAIKNKSINVAFVGNDIYVQGISKNFPQAWVKGTIDGTNITFEKFQYVGNTQNLDCWLIGYNSTTSEIKDAAATYDATTKTITFTDNIFINADAFRVYYAEWYSDVVITAEEKTFEEPVITDLTATLPYLNTFDTTEEQAQAAVYDANEDNSTFTFTENSNTKNTAARYRYHATNVADDYLVFPGVTLKAGTTYTISADAASYSASYPERVEILAGKEAKASKFTIPVIASADIATKEYITLSNGSFTVEEDGVYYFAVHAISDANAFYLWIDNFSIKENDPEAPAAISDFAVKADEAGANVATVTFTMPTTTIGGTAITSDITAVVKRGSDIISTETKAAGTAISFVDNVPAPGFYDYTVSASYGEHTSEATTVKAYVGFDTPDYIKNINIADKSGSVALAWEAPTTGANGYIVKPEDFKYNIYPVEIQEFFGMKFPVADHANPYLKGTTELSANITFDTNTGEHSFKYFSVTAENTAGESEDGYTAIVTGAPYEIPLKESVAGGSLSYWWGTATDDNNNTQQSGLFIGETPSDEDGGCFTMVAITSGWISLQSGKINLAGVANPVLTFDHMATSAASLAITVITPKGETALETITSGTNYAPAKISLVPFANEDWVRVIFTGNFTGANNLSIDNVKVYNCLDHNLAANNITATSRISAGQDVNINVEIENQGALAVAAGAYTVDLYCNDTKVKTVEGPALESNAKTTVEFTEKTNVMTENALVWKAEIVYDADEDKTNNTTATARTTVAVPNYPAVTDLAGAQNGKNVELTWTEPNPETPQPTVVTDDFESYEGFTTNAGDWTFVDVDNAEVGGFQGMEFTVNGVNILQSKQSFWVHDVTDGNTWNQTFAAHSGTKYLAAMFRYDDGQVDDWAISPMLSGNAQTISFWARSYSTQYPESIEILYSTTDKSTGSFTVVKAKTTVPGEWTEYTAELPEGAKYFAIRSCASSSFMLMIDDVTFEKIDVPADLALVGYNVYRDGEKLNAEPVAEPGYVDTNVAEGSHTYVVTVVYDKGESKASNIVEINVTATAIENIENNAAGTKGNVYSVDGVMVRKAGESLNGLKNGVYIIDGKKVVVKK